MAPHSSERNTRAKDQTVDHPTTSEVQTLDLGRLRLGFCLAIDEGWARLGWKKDAIAAAIKADPSYFTKLRSGEKPLTLRHIADLPDDVEALYAKHYARSFDLVVAAPAVGD